MSGCGIHTGSILVKAPLINVSPDRLTQGQPSHSNQIGMYRLWISLDHLMSDHPKWEIKSHPNQLSAHIFNFRSKQLDSVFTPKTKVTGPADHSVIRRKKIEVQRMNKHGVE